MSDEFTLQTEIIGDTLVIRTEGYINNVAGEKISLLFSNNSDGEIKNAIFDLAKSKVINSIGISYLLEVIELLTEKNGKIIFLNLDPSIDKTFKIMGLFQFAQTADSLDSALKVLA
ncbi:MAG: STAS domain-containing protein [Ignavibacteriaceae bacterium]|nr:STAS domain-containing protein [Ignavibacteriaceae bacterium]